MKKNSNSINKEILKTSKYYIAYLDILGAKNFIKSESNNYHFLNDLDFIYKGSINMIIGTKNKLDEIDIKWKIFSDNMLLFIKHDETKLNDFIRTIGIIQCYALSKGYMFRGAITEGEFFNDIKDIFIYGKALVNAVEIEENIAIYPRIVLQESIANYIINNLKNSHIKQDIDGVYYIDLYSCILRNGLQNLIKTELLNNLKKYNNNSKIKQKIMWLVNYHNNFVGDSDIN